MALIKCPECGATISDKADFCPQCGCKKEFFPVEEDAKPTEEEAVEPITSADTTDKEEDEQEDKVYDEVDYEDTPFYSKPWGQLVIVLVVVVGFIFVIFQFAAKDMKKAAKENAVKPAATSITTTPAAPKKTAPATPAKPKATSKWQYSQKKDEMTGKTNYYAMLMSDNYTRFSFPYNNYRINMRICVRKHSRYGTDVLIEVPEGQFMTDYDGTYISVKFDDGKVKSYLCNEPEDMTSTALFISNSKGFIKKLKSSKVCRISAGFYREGSPTFIFKTEGLKWEH